MRIVRKLAPSAAVVATLVLGAATPAIDRSDDGATAARRMDTILRSLSVDGLCPTNCEFSPCPGDTHNNTEQEGGNDGGEIHSCAYGPEGCAAHECSISAIERDEIGELATLMARLDGPSIHVLDLEHEAFLLNTDRAALQIIGCGGQVMLSRNLSPNQATQVSAFDR